MENPKIIVLISGKRKCGKDYISEKLCERLTKNNSEIVRISEPIKVKFAKTHNLDSTQLMGDSLYKEKYRLDMITWSEKIRNNDYGYFCREACDNAPFKKVWIISDIRRKTDIKWFKENYKDLIKTVKITADIEVRKTRGFIFTDGIDDAESECNLDDIEKWDIVITNNSEAQGFEALEILFNFISTVIN